MKSRRSKNIAVLLQYCIKETHSSPVPGSDVNRDEVVQVEFAPLLHLGGESGTEQSAANPGRGAGQEDGGQLIPEASLTVLEQLIGLVHHQPLHAAQHNTTSNTDYTVSFTVKE